MPNDQWARDRGKALGRKAQRGIRHATRLKKAKSEKITTARLKSPDTVLWFGKYTGRKLSEIPKSYLEWLVKNHTPGKNWRLDRVIEYLMQNNSRNG